MNLLLLPGLDGTGILFEPLLAKLDPGITAKVVSYPADKTCGYDKLCQLVGAEIPADEPIVILGESFSGPIAIAMAAAFPTQVKGVILCCTFAKNPYPALAWGGATLDALIDWFPMPCELNWFTTALLLGPYATDDVCTLFARTFAATSPDVMRARLKEVLRVDMSKELSGLTMPVCYWQAQHDRLVPADAAHHVCAINPRVEVTVWDAPHALLQVRAEQAATLVQAFMARVMQ